MNETLKEGRISEEDVDKKLLYYYTALVCRSMAIAQHLHVIGDKDLQEKLNFIKPAEYKVLHQEKTSEENIEPVFKKEQIHVKNFQKTCKYIRTKNDSQKLIVALGTGWIKGYEKGQVAVIELLSERFFNCLSDWMKT